MIALLASIGIAHVLSGGVVSADEEERYFRVSPYSLNIDFANGAPDQQVNQLTINTGPEGGGAYHIEPTWQGGIYASNGLAGSRSGGLIAATWAAMVRYGREGYLRYAKQIFETSFTMQDAVKSHPELSLMGEPTFCFAFRSDEFDIYHVNDFMKTRGWRFNGQQHPEAIHMCVTRPQTREGIAGAFATDLGEAVPYALRHRTEEPQSSAIYGGGASGIPMDSPDAIRMLMTMALDTIQAYPF